MKNCKICYKTKELKEFGNCRQNKDGLQDKCKDCKCIYDKEWRKNNPDKVKKSRDDFAKNNPDKVKKSKDRYRSRHKEEAHQYYVENRDHIRKDQAVYREMNKEDIAINSAQYYQENKEEVRLYGIGYRKENKEKIKTQKAESYQRDKLKNRESKNKKYQEKYDSDVVFRLSVCLRSRLRQVIKKNSKTGSAVKDLGCSVEEFKFYIESKFYERKSNGESMSWDNYGTEWQLDHLEALCSFDLTNRTDFLRACHYTNLQPLWNEDHFEKTVIDCQKRKR